MDLLEKARNSLQKARSNTNNFSSQSHALDSIAASLLYIAENIEAKPVTDEHIELIVRRLLDDRKEPTTKKASKK